MLSAIKREAVSLFSPLMKLDKKTAVIFLSIALLQTLSYYVASKQFFSENLAMYFPENDLSPLFGYLYWFLADCILYLLIPLLIIRYLFKETPGSYGLCRGEMSTGVKWVLPFLALMGIVLWFISADKNLYDAYPQARLIGENYEIFLIFECCIFLYLVAWEFVWRGYMLFGLKEKFGISAVLIQMLPFVILHNGKPITETLGAIAGGVVLGLLAIRTGSFLYGVLVHFGMFFMLDVLLVLRHKSSQYGVGIDALLSLFR